MSCKSTLEALYDWETLAAKPSNGCSAFTVDYPVLTADVYPQAMSLNQVFDETITLVESVIFHFTTSFGDTVELDEAVTILWAPNKALADTLGFAETFTATLSWNPSFGADDIIVLLEDVALELDKPFDESVALVENVALHVTKVFADTIVLTESFQNGHGETVSDNFGLVEQGVLLNQGYFDATGNPNGYFADDYFGDKRTW